MAMMIPMIGITGKAGSGKDTLCELIGTRLGYKRRALADPMKRLLNARFGIHPPAWDDRDWKEEPNPRLGLAPDGTMFSPRSWAQWIGTEAGRALHGQDLWVNNLDNEWAQAGYPQWVVPDVRFDNEAEYVRSVGGLVVRVTRPGVRPIEAHSSEAGVSDHLVDFEVVNDSSFQVLMDRFLVGMDRWSQAYFLDKRQLEFNFEVEGHPA